MRVSGIFARIKMLANLTPFVGSDFRRARDCVTNKRFCVTACTCGRHIKLNGKTIRRLVDAGFFQKRRGNDFCNTLRAIATGSIELAVKCSVTT